MRTLEQFIEKHIGETIITPIPQRPDRQNDDWSKEASHFQIALRNKAGTDAFVCHYSVGSGIVENWVLSVWPGYAALNASMPYGHKSVAYVERIKDRGTKYRPDVRDVLECLQMDFRSVVDSVDYGGFETWAEDLGYDPDSRAAERTYIQVRTQVSDFRSVVGRDAFSTFLEIDPEAETLTLDDVHVEVLVEDERDATPEESFENAEQAAEVRERLESGSNWAWCTITVVVAYGDAACHEHLGRCSYDDEADFRGPGGYFDDMVQTALDRLNDGENDDA